MTQETSKLTREDLEALYEDAVETLRLLANVNGNVTIERGLVWLEDGSKVNLTEFINEEEENN